ncbi:MAG: acyl-ACP thioesterase [Tissierellia bacterium]|nr:acyl-ACP thioesterase [Tissierellia bacterium]
MEPVSSYSKNYKVEVDHVDFNGSLKLSSLFTYFQDIAGLHSENLNMGMETLYENHNVLWVLARIRVDIIRYPLLNEEIIIDTWPQEPDRVGFARDFLARDIQGNILAKAVSTWVIIDVNTRRLKKTKSVYTGYPPTVKERAIDCKLGNLKPRGPLEMVYKRTVRYSDIDVNKHLNNSKYVDFIMDCFSLKDHEKYSIKSIEVNYSKEALPGDSIIIYKDISEVNSNLIYIEGINEKDNKLTFKTQLELEAK